MRSANGDCIPISQLRELGETERPFPDDLASIDVPDRYSLPGWWTRRCVYMRMWQYIFVRLIALRVNYPREGRTGARDVKAVKAT